MLINLPSGARPEDIQEPALPSTDPALPTLLALFALPTLPTLPTRPPVRPAPRHTFDPASCPTHSTLPFSPSPFAVRRSPFSFSGTLRATGHLTVIQHNYFSGRSSGLVADGGWRMADGCAFGRGSGRFTPFPPSHFLFYRKGIG